MKRKNLLLIAITAVLIIAILFLIKPEYAEQEPEAEILLKNLDIPWAIDFMPDGRMIFTERQGRVNIYDFNKKEKKSIAEIHVTEIAESGLLGIAVDPQFVRNNFIYLYYTREGSDGIHNRVSRFVFDENGLKNEKILLDRIPAAKFHDGGRIKFGPDNKIYITTGDATMPSSAQDTNSIAGKILRINKDGTIPEDNPFGNYIYSYGHRNPQGIAWNDNNQLYASEHGPTRNDEINVIIKGKNYGWPIECGKASGTYETPIRCYTEFTLAPSGIAFYKNNLYVAALRGTQLRKITLGNDDKILREEVLFSDFGRIREAVEHDGYLYIATNNKDGRGVPKSDDDKIIRIRLV